MNSPEAFSEDHARQIFDRLVVLVPRQPNQYRYTDEAHVDTLVAVGTGHPTLRQAALDQLIELLAQGDAVAERVLQRADDLFQEDKAVILPRLQDLAAGGSEHAARMLGVLGAYDPQQRERGRQARDRWTAPRHHQPGTVSFGTGAIPDSLLVRALSATDRAAFATRMLDLAVDPEEPAFNRWEFVTAAWNVTLDLDESDRPGLFERVMRLARGDFEPSRADQSLGLSDHRLSRFRSNLATDDTRPRTLMLAARLAGSPAEAAAVQGLALELLHQADAKTTQQVATALSGLPKEHFSIDVRFLATYPHGAMRSLAAIRWADDSATYPELGLSLARDPQPSVRRELARAISQGHAPSLPQVDAVREILRHDPRHSVRRLLQSHPSTPPHAAAPPGSPV